MRSRTGMLSAMSLALALGAGTVLAQDVGPSTAPGKRDKTQRRDEAKERTTAKIGEKAPPFSLEDINGKVYKLEDYKGRIVVLQWINRGCPWCRGVHESKQVKKMVEDVKGMDDKVVFLAIDSTHNLDAKKNVAYLKDAEVATPGLIDRDGTVGRLYGARTTPHMYVIDREGILRYNGAFSDDQRNRKGDKATNYVVNTVRQITAGETVMPDTTRPWGCTIKYKRPSGGERRGGRSG